jgi:hypothetical protein
MTKGAWRLVVGVVVGFVLLFLAAFVALPVPPGADALGTSVGNSVLSSNPCVEEDKGVWRCRRADTGNSSTVPYEVTVSWLGCWEGLRLGPPAVEGGTPKEISGCVTLIDHLR